MEDLTTVVVFHDKTKELLVILAQNETILWSHIYTSHISPPVQSSSEVILSLSRSCVSENSRTNKDPMKSLYMINQDFFHNLFSIFIIQNRKAEYYIRTRNYRDFRRPIINECLSRKTCIDLSITHLARKIVLDLVIPSGDPHLILQCHE